MNSSLPIVPGTTKAPETLQGIGNNIVINQPEAGGGEGFGALLDNQYAAISELPEAALEAAVDSIAILPEIQNLPLDGKLLPFLEETLGMVVDSDIDGQQLLGQLSARLEMLEPAEAEAVVQSLAGLVQPLSAQVATVPNVIPAEGAVLPLVGKNQAALPQGQLAALIQQQLGSSGQPRNTGPQLSSVVDAAVLKQSVGEQSSLPSSQTGQDAAMQQPQAIESRQSDLALIMSAFRRQQTDIPRLAGTDGPAGAELIPVTGNSATPVVTSSTVASSTLPATSVQTPFGQADWDQSVGERVQWMVGQKMQAAQVKLNPANLGPMEVRIQIQNDQASVQFSAHHAVVREALEAALPRLREMFEASGVELVDVDVSGQSFAEQQAAGQDAAENAWRGVETDTNTTPELILESDVASLAQTGRLDLFA